MRLVFHMSNIIIIIIIIIIIYLVDPAGIPVPLFLNIGF